MVIIVTDIKYLTAIALFFKNIWGMVCRKHSLPELKFL